MADNAPRTARARVRAELTNEIKQVARRQLAAEGSAGLSLRAVARELGMVSSAVYRYFPSRDELLTALIVDAYTAVGARATAAESVVRRADFAGRLLAVATATREWAVANPHEYALIFGSPVPGYAAPVTTIDPAAVIPSLLLAILAEAAAAGRVPADHAGRMPRVVHADLRRLREQAAPQLSDRHLARAVLAWSQLIGLISFELFGHLHNVITDYQAHFEYQLRTVAEDLGLA
ncbi:MAG TPA: TetR/AcrR family transcriptional regulator [Jatrophihabitans sp.]|nr:TetR/AcrR family transcriptional regulator [Jatrophihabitans sp.]